jgi:hypothetical protein
VGTAAEFVVGIIECAAAAFARVARQITGCTPTSSHIDERTAVVEVGMVVAGSRKRPRTPAYARSHYDNGLTEKRRQSQRFS